MTLQYIPLLWNIATVFCIPITGKSSQFPSSYRPISFFLSLFLSDRSFPVRASKEFSGAWPIADGIPQRFTSSTILCNIYSSVISRYPRVITSSYADYIAFVNSDRFILHEVTSLQTTSAFFRIGTRTGVSKLIGQGRSPFLFPEEIYSYWKVKSTAKELLEEHQLYT